MAKATLTTETASLSTEFGLSRAVWLFGQEAIDALPTLKAGKNKGKPKGYVIWLKVATPGFTPYVDGGAGAGQTVRAWIGAGPFAGQDDALRAPWVGRIGPLCLSACYLGPEGRQRRLSEASAA